MSALDWPGLESLEFDAPQRAFGHRGTRRPNWPRTRCCTRRRRRWTSAPGCTRCAPLYANARTPAQRVALLERLEDMALETAHLLAVDLLRNGWRPD